MITEENFTPAAYLRLVCHLRPKPTVLQLVALGMIDSHMFDMLRCDDTTVYELVIQFPISFAEARGLLPTPQTVYPATASTVAAQQRFSHFCLSSIKP